MYGDLETHDAPVPGARRASRACGCSRSTTGSRRSTVPGGVRRRARGLPVGGRATPTSSAPTRDRLAVGGDSAGGNLAAGVAIEAARSRPAAGLPAARLPGHRPVRDTESAALFADGFYLTKAFMDLASASYVPAPTSATPRISPAYADLPAGLAPAYVATAGFDPLRDEGEGVRPQAGRRRCAGRAAALSRPDPRVLQRRRRRPHQPGCHRRDRREAQGRNGPVRLRL